MPQPIKAYLGAVPLFDAGQSSSGYVRPADWLPLPAATANTVKGLYAVFDQPENYVTVQMVTADNSTYTIDWGDGTTTTGVSNTIHIKNYDYNNVGDLSTRGYKQAIISVAPQAGKVFTFCSIANKPTTPAGFQTLSSGWLDLNVNLPNLTSAGARLQIGSISGIIHRLLERVNITSWGAQTSTTQLFRNCVSLSSLNETEWNFANITNPTSMFMTSGVRSLNCENWDMSKVTSLSNIFRDCQALKSVKFSTWNLSACTGIDQLFMGCGGLEDVDVSNWNVSNVALFMYAFQGCRSLRNINVANWNTAKVTAINNMFEGCAALTDLTTTSWTLPLCTTATNFLNNCGNLRKVGPLNFSAVTTILNAGFAANCNSLTDANISGLKVSAQFTNCLLSATKLNALYNNLATVANLSQTLTVSGNYGTASDDPSIATGKGWIVTG